MCVQDKFDVGSLQKGAHDLPVEGVGPGAGEAVPLPVAKLPDQPLVAVNVAIEVRRVEDVPFIDVAGDQPGQAEVPRGAFPEVVEDQFVQRLGIGAGGGDHLGGVGRVLCFDDDGDGVAGGPPRVDDQVGPVFRVDFTDVPIPDLGEEIGDDPFQVLLGLALIDPVEQPFEPLPEEVERLAGDGLAQPGAVDGFFDRHADDIHGGISSMDKASRKTIYHEKREYAFRFSEARGGASGSGAIFNIHTREYRCAKKRRGTPLRICL